MPRMRIVRSIPKMRDASDGLPRPLGFVPTMGALHDGHLALVRESRRRASATVASVFVNPAQFASAADVAGYPRDEAGDLAALEREHVDTVFTPPADAMFPPGSVTRVAVQGPPARGFEADVRPGHFDGVATIVVKLLGIVRPDLLFLGEKDAQQLAVVRRVLADLDVPVRVVPVPTVREADGLAMSSRNRLLSPAERRVAPRLYAALRAGREAALAAASDTSPSAGHGERPETPSAGTITDAARAVLASGPDDAPPLHVDYLALVDPDSFRSLTHADRPALLVAAVAFGNLRLIDNLPIDVAHASMPRGDDH